MRYIDSVVNTGGNRQARWIVLPGENELSFTASVYSLIDISIAPISFRFPWRVFVLMLWFVFGIGSVSARQSITRFQIVFGRR